MKKLIILFIALLFLISYVYAEETTLNLISPNPNATGTSITGYMDELKGLLDEKKKISNTYLGVVSSQKGKSLVNEINKQGEAIVIATSKTAFCMMKKLDDGTFYCVDNTGFAGNLHNCSTSNISCKPPFSEISFNPTTQVKTEEVSTESPANTNQQIVTPSNTGQVVTEVKSLDEKMKEVMIQLREALESHKSSAGTYLGVVSSQKGKDLVSQLNVQGQPVVIATSKDAFCIMKKMSDNRDYCLDSIWSDGFYDGCSSKNVSCVKKQTGISNSLNNDSNASANSQSIRMQLIEKIKQLILERSKKKVTL